MPADGFPLVSANLGAGANVASARVYFKSDLGSDFYYVEMTLGPGGFVGTLPKPTPNAGHVTYYIEALGKDGTVTRTADLTSVVAPNAAGCPADNPPGPTAPTGPASVFSPAGVTGAPAGFSGISTVVAGTVLGGVGGGGVIGGLGAGALIAGGAILAGVTILVVNNKNSGSQ